MANNIVATWGFKRKLPEPFEDYTDHAISFPRFIIPPIASASNVWQNGSSHITALSFSFNTFERVTIVSQCVYASGNVSPSPSVTSERIPAELSYVQLKSFISPIFFTLPLRITKIEFSRFIRVLPISFVSSIFSELPET